MNDLVPGFYEMDYEYSNIPASSTTGTEERVSELLWHNGNIFTTKNQPMNPSNNKTTGGEIDDQQQHLFMQEDEMASLLQFPLDGICSDLLYADPNPPPPTSAVTQSILAAEIRSPPPPVTTAPRLQNFALFSTGARVSRSEAAKVDSVASATAGGLASGTYDLTTTSSSPGGSRASLSSEAHQPPPQKPAKDRKRKNADEESQSEEIECEAKKPAGASTSTKRSRAAEVHNLSERRRRDKINEKMKALQDLVPKCNGSDKASMLEDTIQYVKTMQTQLQMMSMNMYPGPLVPYPPYMVPMPAPFLTQQIHIASNETDRSVNLNQYQNQQRMPNLVDQNQLYQIQSQQRMVNPNQLYQNQLRNIVDPSQLLYQNQLRMPSLVDPNQLYQNQLQIPSLVDPNRLYQNQPLMQPNTFNPYQQFVGMQQPQNQSASQHGVNELSSRDRQATYPDDK